MSRETIDVAKSHTSWMNFKDNREFKDIMKNPFNFQYIKVVQTEEEYRKIAFNESGLPNPVVVITSMASFDQGFSRQLLREFSMREQNRVIFIERMFDKFSNSGNLFSGKKTFKVSQVQAVKPTKRTPRNEAAAGTSSATKSTDPRKGPQRQQSSMAKMGSMGPRKQPIDQLFQSAMANASD